MKIARIILTLLLVIVIVVFSVQNAEVVEVTFLGWSIETSRALLILISTAFGSLCTILALLPTLLRKRNSKSLNSVSKGNLQEKVTHEPN